MTHDAQQLLSIATEAARRAGQFLLQYKKEGMDVTYEGKDTKIAADKESENIIIAMLGEKTNISILTEEIGEIAKDTATSLRWIIDPLDGTLNFVRGIPESAVSIALWDGDTPLLGVVYQFLRNECYTGIVGTGAFLNGVPIQVSDVTEAKQGVIMTGFPSKTDFSDNALRTFIEEVQTFRKVRLIGSAVVSLAYVAGGYADAYAERGIYLWDVAAGIAIVQAAGGKTLRMEHIGGYQYDVVVTNGRITV